MLKGFRDARNGVMRKQQAAEKKQDDGRNCAEFPGIPTRIFRCGVSEIRPSDSARTSGRRNGFRLRGRLKSGLRRGRNRN